MVDEQFHKRLPIRLRSADREDRKVSIKVAVEIHNITTPTHRKELVVRLTDENDLFFLYTLQLGEEDFQSLKMQQGLLVDFMAFPQRFIDLLQMVLQEEHKESPKFILELVCSGTSGLGGSTAILNVIETNPFKHLTHLALKFLPGTDNDVKKYLANCLKTLKEQNAVLMERFEHTEGDLSGQLHAAREALAARTTELDQLKTEWANRTTTLATKHQSEMTKEHENFLNQQAKSQQRYDSERRELEQAHSKTVKQLEVRLYDMEILNKDLTDKKYRSESAIRELKSKLSLLEEEHHRTNAEVQALRKDNSGLDTGYHEQEKVINQLKTRLAVLEQELKDKEEVLQKSTTMLNTDKEQRRKLEENQEHNKKKISKLEVSLKTVTEELVKGNEIIKKFQGELKNTQSKLKLRCQISSEQEKVLAEKHRDIEELKKDLENTKRSLKLKDEENSKLNETLETTMQKLDESRQLLKTNENVIQWLNKQVTEVQLSQNRPGAGPFEMNCTGSTITSSASAAYRPHIPGPPVHNYSGPYATSRMSSSTLTQGSGGGQYPSLAQRYQPQVHFQPGASRKGGLPAPLAKSSPVETIHEERERLQDNAHASPPHLSKQPQSGDRVLDKYLEKSEEVPLRSVAPRSTSPTPIDFTAARQTPPPAASLANPNRLSKDMIVTKTAMPSSGRQSQAQQPPLASAYFPGQTRVS